MNYLPVMISVCLRWKHTQSTASDAYKIERGNGDVRQQCKRRKGEGKRMRKNAKNTTYE